MSKKIDGVKIKKAKFPKTLFVCRGDHDILLSAIDAAELLPDTGMMKIAEYRLVEVKKRQMLAAVVEEEEDD